MFKRRGAPRAQGSKVATAAIFMVMLSGCETLSRNIENPARIDPITMASYVRPPGDERKEPADGATGDTKGDEACPMTQGTADLYMGAIDLNCFKFPGGIETAYVQAAKPDNDGKLARNRLASVLIKQSDDLCTIQMARMSALDAATNTSLGILTTAFSTAASIISGEKAKSILSGGATLFSSSRDHINAQVYRNQLTQAISLAITGERQTIRRQIEARFIDPQTSWNVDDAVRSVNQYHQTCSFYRGLELLLAAARDTEEVGEMQRERAEEKEIERLTAAIAALRDDNALTTTSPAERTHNATLINDLSTRRAQLLAGGNLPARSGNQR
jgi:hypothetical protein